MEDIQYVKNRVSFIINEADDCTQNTKELFNVRDIARILDQLGIYETQIIDKDKIIESQKIDLKWNTETYNKLRDEANNRGSELLKLKMKSNSDLQIYYELGKKQEERIVFSEVELQKCEVLLNESLKTLKWMFENMKVVDTNLQSDAFNIPANTIDELEKYLEIFNK